MRLTTLGTGAAAPSAARVNAGHLVEVAGVRLLLDCGSGIVHRMAALGVDWSALTHIALTHFHADHVSDLATLFVAWRWGQLPPRSAPVMVLGPPGTEALLQRHAAALWDELLAPGFDVQVRELPFGEATELAPGVRLGSRKVPHTPESVAYSVESGPARLVYTGDTGFDPSLGEWARGSDVLLMECSLPDAMGVSIHLTPSECGRLAALADPGVLALTHFYPPVEQDDVEAVIAAGWSGVVVRTHDGWTHDIQE